MVASMTAACSLDGSSWHTHIRRVKFVSKLGIISDDLNYISVGFLFVGLISAKGFTNVAPSLTGHVTLFS